jgi:hypothetical protein
MLPTATTANKMMTLGSTRNSPVSATPTVMEDGGYCLDFQVFFNGICRVCGDLWSVNVKW